MNWLPPDGALRGIALDHLLGWNLSIVFWLAAAAQVLLVLALVRRGGSEPGRRTPGRYFFLHVLPLLAIVALYVWMLVTSHGLWAARRETTAPAQALEVEVTGVQFQWYFRYPGQDGVYGATQSKLVSAPAGNPLGIDAEDPHAADDVVSSVMMLPAGRPVAITLRTQDVIHGFFVPGMRLKQDAIPGMTGHLEFTPEIPGDYPILCSQVCGLGHYRMQARMRVVTPEQFASWLAGRERGR